jgi:hypothetical protein
MPRTTRHAANSSASARRGRIDRRPGTLSGLRASVGSMRSEFSICVGRGNVQPILEPVWLESRAVQAVGSLISGLALARTLWTRIRRQLHARSFELSAWPFCCGACRSTTSERAVVPSATPGSRSTNAWPGRPRQSCGAPILGSAPSVNLKVAHFPSDWDDPSECSADMP